MKGERNVFLMSSKFLECGKAFGVSDHGHQRVLGHRVHAAADDDERREAIQHGQVVP